MAASPDVRFAGVWSRTFGPAERLASRYAVPVFERYDDLLDSCQAVAFAVPPAAQVDLAITAVQRGLAVLLEKPLAVDVAGAKELATEIERANVVSLLALTWRYAPAVRQFLQRVVPRTHPIGATARATSSLLTEGTPARTWWVERSVLFDQGPDIVDLLDAALGRIRAVRGHGNRLGWIGLLLEHEGGRFSEASLSAHAGVQPRRAEVEIVGSNGVADIDCAAAVGSDAYTTMYAEFASAVQFGTPVTVDAHRARRLHEVLDRAETDLLRSL
jgi:predicted dehydrogenase